MRLSLSMVNLWVSKRIKEVRRKLAKQEFGSFKKRHWLYRGKNQTQPNTLTITTIEVEHHVILLSNYILILISVMS